MKNNLPLFVYSPAEKSGIFRPGTMELTQESPPDALEKHEDEFRGASWELQYSIKNLIWKPNFNEEQIRQGWSRIKFEDRANFPSSNKEKVSFVSSVSVEKTCKHAWMSWLNVNEGRSNSFRAYTQLRRWFAPHEIVWMTTEKMPTRTMVALQCWLKEDPEVNLGRVVHPNYPHERFFPSGDDKMAREGDFEEVGFWKGLLERLLLNHCYRNNRRWNEEEKYEEVEAFLKWWKQLQKWAPKRCLVSKNSFGVVELPRVLAMAIMEVEKKSDWSGYEPDDSHKKLIRKRLDDVLRREWSQSQEILSQEERCVLWSSSIIGGFGLDGFTSEPWLYQLLKESFQEAKKKGITSFEEFQTCAELQWWMGSSWRHQLNQNPEDLLISQAWRTWSGAEREKSLLGYVARKQNAELMHIIFRDPLAKLWKEKSEAVLQCVRKPSGQDGLGVILRPIQCLSADVQLDRLQAWWKSVEYTQRKNAYEAILALDSWDQDFDLKEKLSPWIQNVAMTVVENLKAMDWETTDQVKKDVNVQELSLSWLVLKFTLAHSDKDEQELWFKQVKTLVEGLEALGLDWNALRYRKNTWRGDMDSLEASIKAILMSTSWHQTESLSVKPKQRF